MSGSNKDKFKELYDLWAEEEWSEEDSLKSVRLARELTKLQPSSVDAWDALATSIMGVLFPPDKEFTDNEKDDLRNNPLFWEMVEAFENEIKIDPDESAPSWNRAICFERIGLYDRAYKDYLGAAETDKRSPSEYGPSPSMDYFKAGEVIYKHGDYRKAIEALKASLEEEGELQSETWYYLAKSYEKLGDTAEALEAYQQAANLNPKTYKKELLGYNGGN